MRKRRNKGKVHFAWIVLFGVCVLMGFARGGIHNAGGLFMAPVMEELGCGAGAFMLYFSISSVVTFLFLPAAGKLMGKYDIRLLLVLSLVFHAGSFMLLGLMRNIWGWYLLSIPMALGSILTTQIGGPVLIGNWFCRYTGVATGIMMAASGLFGALFQPLAGMLITNIGWRSAYFVLGGLVLAVSVPVVLLTIRFAPQEKGMRPFGADQIDKCIESSGTSGIPVEKARKTAAFWELFAFMFFLTAAASFAQHLPKYADQLGFDPTFAGKAMGVFMVGTLLGAIAFGLMNDRIGAKRTTILALFCGETAIVTLILGGGKPTLFNAAVLVFGFASASVGTMGPLLATAIFGQKDYGRIYSAIAMGMALAGVVSMAGYGFIYDAFRSYVPVLWSICAMLLVCAACVVAAFASQNKNRTQERNVI